jgi:hypothetical protein
MRTLRDVVTMFALLMISAVLIGRYQSVVLLVCLPIACTGLAYLLGKYSADDGPGYKRL